MARHIGLDFETYSGTDLIKHGLERYIEDEHFTPLIAGVHIAGQSTHRLDFINEMEGSKLKLTHWLKGNILVAQNAGFELAVLKWLGIEHPLRSVIDSAVVARGSGAGSKLEAAAPQLLGVDKLADGGRLIKKFCVPGKLQEENESNAFDPRIIEQNPDDWELLHVYCDLDSELCYSIVDDYINYAVLPNEFRYQEVTMKMNNVGWRVDLEMVEEMQARYLQNKAQAEEDFRQLMQLPEFNFNSLKQMKDFCMERGVRATSFDEQHVESMLRKVEDRLQTLDPDEPKYAKYWEVIELLRCKQILGGSSLKKLAVILNTTAGDGRLRDQYMHVGAGQSFRTTGRGVQMQNLKRLGINQLEDMNQILDLDLKFSNEVLAENLRQVFTATHPKGSLIVGDFSSVESRGLAWWADAHWKLDAYRFGKDMYKVLAASMFSIPYDEVDKPQRQAGKVGELSCGYQAAGGAVQSFAAGMGIVMSEPEAADLVSNWRSTNPEVVALWAVLDDMLRKVVEGGAGGERYRHSSGYEIRIRAAGTPQTLLDLHPGAKSIVLEVLNDDRNPVMRRVFHGCYVRGRSICYYKPSERKGGDLWVNHFKDPKTKQIKFYNIYGGKLAGILTQSFCREIFFKVLDSVDLWVKDTPGIELVGQFHDEIVLDYDPTVCSFTLEEAKTMLGHLMSTKKIVPGFPLEADIKDDYRYTK